MRDKDIVFVREMCTDITNLLDLIESIRKKPGRVVCDTAEGQMRAEATPSWEKPLRHGVRRSIEDAAEDYILDAAFSILMCAMGEGIPKSLFSYNDYSLLYSKIGERGEDWTDDA